VQRGGERKMISLDATAWVAIAGILGTLLSSVVAERVRRKSDR
jgi:hypothetical protein